MTNENIFAFISDEISVLNELQNDDNFGNSVEFSSCKQKYSSTLLSRSKVSSEINESLSSSQMIIRRSIKRNVKKYNQLSGNTLSNLDWTQSPSSYSREFCHLFTYTITSKDDVKTEMDYVRNLINLQSITPITNISNSNTLLPRLINYAINGQLRVCHFRSICWRIFLDILPNDVSQWAKQLKKDREYFATLNCRININPYINQIKSDDHPLSYSRTSLWNKYFYSLKIKRIIAKDVNRTFPKVEYFHNQNIHNIMIDLLYIYTEHENISYQQGMHEILAPLLFVLHCDLTAFEHVVEMKIISSDLWNDLNYIMNKEYFQADVYMMFAKIMNSVKNWYPQTKLSTHEKRIRRRTIIGLPTTILVLKSEANADSNDPEQTPMVTNKIQDSIDNNNLKYFKIYYENDNDELDGEDHEETKNDSEGDEIIEKYERQNKDQLKQPDGGDRHTFHFDQEEHSKHNCSGDCFVEQIHKQLLLRHNPLLYNHLKKLEISPKLFGLKWIRLLFGHEFPLQDLLYIWDCIFAVNNNLAFVPYMYLSMLLRLAPTLIKYEFAECLTLLMNYPAGMDVTKINDIHDNTSCSSNDNPNYDARTTNYVKNDSDAENIDKINISANSYSDSGNNIKNNPIPSLSSLSNKIKSKLKNTPFSNLVNDYRKKSNINNPITNTDIIKRSKTFKNSKQVMGIPRGRSLADLASLKKPIYIKSNEENIRLSDIMISTESTNNNN
ncbi:unnamed protein product [Schistosoma mattheei]|uniref:Uncharacterized protein n=1 Tax=Schistosoma mattheei TaxID=31246 RepID=A0A183PC29_9TREM|nr:unnamed protein product [Schistosoma mattheei]